MYVNFSLSLIVLCILTVAAAAQRTIDGVRLGIINGSTASMPRPVYPQELKDFCVGGKVEVLVELMASGGKPLTAKAISGDELLRGYAEDAAAKAVFYPRQELIIDFKVKGILVYNFPVEEKCINVGIVNEKAVSLPKPVINPDIKIKQETIVKLGVIIDESGKVVSAQTLTNIHPLLRPFFEDAARRAKFYPTNDVGKLRVKAFIVYKLKSNGKVET